MEYFEVTMEDPPQRKSGPTSAIDWKIRLEQIKHVGRWFLIGRWNNLGSASVFKKKLLEKYGKEFSFRSAAFKETKESKLYAMKIK